MSAQFGSAADATGRRAGAARRRLLRLVVALCTSLALTCTGLIALPAGAARAAEIPPPGLPPVAQRTDRMVTADSLPTAQIGNGVVWTQAIGGDTVYAGGDFSTARPPGAPAGTSEVPRSNLLAYRLSSGQLTEFAPVINSKVYATALSPDKKRLYVGGAFTTVNGQQRGRIAAFDTATGALVASFAPTFGYNVKSIVATDTTVYVGGLFASVNGNTRMRLAALRASDGALTSWAPSADLNVQSIALTPDRSKLVVAGTFTTLNEVAAPGLGAVDATTGAVVTWRANQSLNRNSGSTGGFYSVAADANSVYATAWAFGGSGNFEGTVKMSPDDGSIQWMEDCHGDTYAVHPASSGAVYTLSHAHQCATVGGYFESDPWSINMRHALAFSTQATGKLSNNQSGGNYGDYVGTPAPSMINWFPTLDPGTFTGQSQAGWTITGNDDYVVMGGEFPKVNLKGQQGLARFATRPAAPGKRPPALSAGSFVPQLRSLTSGSVRVAFRANTDTDDMNLTYRVIRDGDTARPVATFSAASTFWDRPALGYTDTWLAPGSTHSYRVFATDQDGNTAQGDPVSITLPTSGPTSGYAERVQADGAQLQWRLGEQSGSSVLDWAGVQDGASRGLQRGVTGAIRNDADTASRFTGSSSSTVNTTTATQAPRTFSLEAWVRTSSSTGGKILGFGDRQTGNSSRYDRHLYMNASGRLVLGTFTAAVQTVTSPNTYNDGNWHHVVGTVGPDGLRLYVDGAQVASGPGSGGESYQGYWRVGGDSLGAWPNRPANDFFRGDIDEVAVYPGVLTPERIRGHHALGTSGSAPANVAPTAAFTADSTNLQASFDASGSVDPDGSIASYTWDFGDGTPAGSAVRTTHAYAGAGSYTVRLTVTDNAGASATTQRVLTVTGPPPPNQPPTASFTQQVTDRRISVDASGSADPDGSISSYAWDFGDGTPPESGVRTAHTYAAAGSYTVRLTVTDDDGATATTSRQVAVAASPASVQDTFARSVTNGLGAAEIGGGYTLFGPAANYAVTAGTARMRLVSAGQTQRAFLNSTTLADADARVEVSLDKTPVGGNVYTSFAVRRQGSSDYRALMLWRPDGRLSLYLNKTVNGAATTLRNLTLPDLTLTPGDAVLVRLQVTGTSPARVRAKVWRVGTTEPAAWTIDQTDTTPELAGPGSVGLETYLAGTATNAPIEVRVDNLLARTADAP